MQAKVDYRDLAKPPCDLAGKTESHVTSLGKLKDMRFCSIFCFKVWWMTHRVGNYMEDLAVDKIVSNGVGLASSERAAELYDALHSYLSRAGIDGVKVNVIHILELLSEGLGGRVELAKAYFNGLSESVRKYFKGNEVIANMERCNDFVYLGTEQITLNRVGRIRGCIQGRKNLIIAAMRLI